MHDILVFLRRYVRKVQFARRLLGWAGQAALWAAVGLAPLELAGLSGES
jgi:hypothetical protein